jgi:hypothetical protein
VELTPTATARNKKRVRPKLRRRVPTRWKRRGELVAVGETLGREREVAVSLLLTHASTERARLQKNERRERATGDKREKTFCTLGARLENSVSKSNMHQWPWGARATENG